MRVAIGIHKDVERAIDAYHMLSGRWMTHASPTVHSGTPPPALVVLPHRDEGGFHEGI